METLSHHVVSTQCEESLRVVFFLQEFFIQLCNGLQGMQIEKKLHLPAVDNPAMLSEILKVPFMMNNF